MVDGEKAHGEGRISIAWVVLCVYNTKLDSILTVTPQHYLHELEHDEDEG